MNRRKLVQYGFGGVASLLGSAVFAEELEVKIGPKKPVRTNVPETNYARVRGNPRLENSVEAWSQAIDYMQQPGFQNDVNARLIKGLPPSFHPFYKNGLVPELNRIIALAARHNHPYACKSCIGGCAERDFLQRNFRKLPIAPGTVYLAVTEGRYGKVRINREFVDRRKVYHAYRVTVEAEIKRFMSAATGKTCIVYARTFFDLIAACGNAALGEALVWERVQFRPPTVETKIPPPPRVARRPPSSRAVAEAYAEATATATGGSVTNIYQSPQSQLTYRRPPSPTYERDTFGAGGISILAVPDIEMSQFQQQQQSQFQQQFLEFWQEIYNQNIANASVGVAVS